MIPHSPQICCYQHQQAVSVLSHLSSLIHIRLHGSTHRAADGSSTNGSIHRAQQASTQDSINSPAYRSTHPISRSPVTSLSHDARLSTQTLPTLSELSQDRLLLRGSSTASTTTLSNRFSYHSRSGQWRNSHISAPSFFENKTGFPITSIHSSHHPPPCQASFNKICPILQEQSRAFKTKRSKVTTGFGHKDTDQHAVLGRPVRGRTLVQTAQNYWDWFVGTYYQTYADNLRDRWINMQRDMKNSQSPYTKLVYKKYADKLKGDLDAVDQKISSSKRRYNRSQDSIGSTSHHGAHDNFFKLRVDGKDMTSGAESPGSSHTNMSGSINRAFNEGVSLGETHRRLSAFRKWTRRLGYLLLALIVLWNMRAGAAWRRLFSSDKDGEDGGRGRLGSLLGSNRFTAIKPETVSVTFDDVRGAYEAKEELEDIVNFLKDPEKYTALGAKLPKGVLVIGPPGVGKTLLARAVAGEAKVPFFQASGSEFDEMFVGVGAQRVRQLFEAAKQAAPCIVFIDEFDAVGAKRTSSMMDPHANQTINQLLHEMDGFKANEGVVVMGSTNLVKHLDKALRRPGRFDVEVTVSLPNLKARQEILELYVSRIKKHTDVDVLTLARGTIGLSGADLENLVNQAALRAVIQGAEAVSMAHFDFARDKIRMGPERQHNAPDTQTNRTTAFHEAGHTLVAYLTPHATPLYKVTILPRGESLGHTSFLPDKDVDSLSHTLASLKAQLDVGMGGRVAEEVIMGEDRVTTGASSDLEQCTRIATMMVTQVGLSDKVGLRVFDPANKDLGPDQMEAIDTEIKRLLDESYERARTLLRKHKTELTRLATALLHHETLDKGQIQAAIEGRPVQGKPN